MPAFEILQRSGQATQTLEGARDGGGRIWGTNIHGLFDNDTFRHRFVSDLCERVGRPGPARVRPSWGVDQTIDRWTEVLRAHLDVPAIYRLLEGKE